MVVIVVVIDVGVGVVYVVVVCVARCADDVHAGVIVGVGVACVTVGGDVVGVVGDAGVIDYDCVVVSAVVDNSIVRIGVVSSC